MRDERKKDQSVRLVELPSPFPLEPGTLWLIEPPQGFGATELQWWRESTPGRPFAFDSGNMRHLYFNTVSTQSSMQLDEPDALVMAYTRKMMAFLLFVPQPRDVLMIGLGGGSLAKFCYRNLPRTRISVVEVNPDVIALREHFAIPRDDERFEVILGDGAALLSKVPVTPDVILIDAFDAEGVAPSLASSDFYRQARQSLTAQGVLVMNLSGQKSRYPIHIESIRAAFGGAVRLVPVPADGNVLLFAFKRRRLAELPDALRKRATRLQQGLGLEFPMFLERLRAAEFLGTDRHRPM
jgi:spermidine synthase